jgi:Tol biopolymer transport system component
VWWNNGRPVLERERIDPVPPRSGLPTGWIVTGCVLAAVGLAVVLSRIVMAWPASSANRPLRTSPFTSYTGSFRMPAFSPDGERVAFSWTGPTAQGNWDIYVKAVGGGTPVRLTTDPGEDNPPAWSPDGRQIAFLRSKDPHVGLHVMNASGGPERKLVDVNLGRYFNLQWTRDGTSIVFAEKTSPHVPFDSLESMAIFLVSVDTLEKRQLTFPLRHPESDHRFAISPDGARLAFLRHGYNSGVGIFTMPIGGGEPKRLHIEHAWVGHIVWDADGRSLVFTSKRDGGNRMFRISVAGGGPQPVPIAEESAYSPSIAPKGDRLVYVREYFDTDLMRVDLSDANRTAVPIAASARLETAPAFSPDGRKLAYFSEQSGRRELWMSNADGTHPTQMTDFFAWDTSPPAWSHDGKHLTVALGRGPNGSAPGLFVMDVENRQVRRLVADGNYTMPHWSRDGRWIYATVGTIGNRYAVRVPAQGGTATPVTGRGTLMPRESPDGRYLYYLKETGGIWRIPADGGPESLVVEDFTLPSWSNWSPVEDGIYYLNRRGPFRTTVDFYDFAAHRVVAEIPGEPLLYEGGLTVSPDRKWMVHSQVSRSASDIMLVDNFR